MFDLWVGILSFHNGNDIETRLFIDVISYQIAVCGSYYLLLLFHIHLLIRHLKEIIRQSLDFDKDYLVCRTVESNYIKFIACCNKIPMQNVIAFVFKKFCRNLFAFIPESFCVHLCLMYIIPSLTLTIALPPTTIGAFFPLSCPMFTPNTFG